MQTVYRSSSECNKPKQIGTRKTDEIPNSVQRQQFWQDWSMKPWVVIHTPLCFLRGWLARCKVRWLSLKERLVFNGLNTETINTNCHCVSCHWQRATAQLHTCAAFTWQNAALLVWAVPSNTVNTTLVHAYVDIKLYLQTGRSQRVGSINRDLDTVKLHSALIRQPAVLLNKWKCIPFRSVPSVCLCAFRHPKEFQQNTNSSSNFPQLPVAFTAWVPLPLHLSSHADSWSHRIRTVVSNQGNHSQRATNRSLIWSLVWSDAGDSQRSPPQLPLSAIFSVISGRSLCQEVAELKGEWYVGRA